MISQTVEYALRTIVTVARNQDSLLTTKEVAEMAQVPPHYLYKVIQPLTRSGLLQSKRGKGGGLALSKPPEELSLLAVIDAVDPIVDYKECPLQLAEHADGLCPLHNKISEVITYVRASFGQTTLDQLVSENHLDPLCVQIKAMKKNKAIGENKK